MPCQQLSAMKAFVIQKIRSSTKSLVRKKQLTGRLGLSRLKLKLFVRKKMSWKNVTARRPGWKLSSPMSMLSSKPMWRRPCVICCQLVKQINRHRHLYSLIKSPAYNFGRSGHFAKDCTQGMKCHYYQKFGRLIKDCHKRQHDNHGAGQTGLDNQSLTRTATFRGWTINQLNWETDRAAL